MRYTIVYSRIEDGVRCQLGVKKLIQNGGPPAILDVNTLGAVTRTTPTGFLSNVVQREYRKSYMVFHLVAFALTESNLERSNRGQAYFRGL